MNQVILVLAVGVVAPSSFAAEHAVRFPSTENVLPSLKAIVLVKASEPGPDAAKHQAVAEIAKYGETLQLPGAGPFDVYWRGKNGIAIRVVSGQKLNPGEVKEIKVSDYVGVVNVRGDNQPRAALITIAPQDDPGPDEKGHRPIQTSKEYREDMAVPDGFYSLWITPGNGTRPRKINDRFRVQAGKTVQLD